MILFTDITGVCNKYLQCYYLQILLVFAQDQNLTKLLAKCIDYCSKQSIEELKKTMNFDKIAPQNLCNLLEVR